MDSFLGMFRAFFFFELPTKNFSHRVFGKLGQEGNFPGQLELGQPLLQKIE
jgi:hypothetical protein